MPHLIIEHSRDITLKTSLIELVKELHYGFAEQETINLAALKTRTLSAENVLIGDESKKEFLYLRVLLLAGRSQELKSKFSHYLDSVIKKHVSTATCATCIEICDLAHYTKD